jgi:formate-dependent nitrite reductase cytochrome c552 subunit
VYGIGFAEIAGSTAYPTAGGSTHLNAGATCVGCHMAAYGDGQGGHTWNPSMAACNACHSGADVTEDYDYKGYQTEMEELLVDLRDLLVAQGVVEYVEADAAYEPVVGTYTMVQAQAFFNWIGLEEDRSLGAHNPDYVKALLENSIEALQ